MSRTVKDRETEVITFLMLLVFAIAAFVGSPIVAFVYFGPWAGSITAVLSISLYIIWCLRAPQATFLTLLRGNLRRSTSREESLFRTMLAYRDRASFESVSEADLLRAAQVFSICPFNSTVARMWIELVKKKRGGWLSSDDYMEQLQLEFERLRRGQ
jgi:hypothetical protein